jgi:hypothetical protein
MNTTRQPTTGPDNGPPLWRRGLALVCCFLAFLTSGSPEVLFSALPAQALLVNLGESEGRAPPVEEDEDGKDLNGQNREAARAQLERPRRRGRQGTRTDAWHAHLPHHHAGTTGYALPAHSPFASGAATLPLRC